MLHVNMANGNMVSVFFTFIALVGSASASGCYGNLMYVHTTGASCQTAGYDQLPYCGVQASEKMAETDFNNVNKYKEKIYTVAGRLCVDAAIIAAITSRETRAGGYIQNGWGDNGNAWGLMQVDKRYHELRGDWDSVEHLTQGTEILIYMIGEIGRKFPYWTLEQRLKGGLAAYNMGPGNVVDEDVDKFTTGRDYSNDVVARAKYFKNRGF
ncbi:lysozyme g-like [Discoglossus pictus]